MSSQKGIGLAAPQVGILRRVVLCSADPKETPLVLVNPEILSVSDLKETSAEGCLSFPDQLLEVSRPEEVTVRWQNLKGRLQTQTFDGLLARVIQHEIDHLNGVLYIDHSGTV